MWVCDEEYNCPLSDRPGLGVQGKRPKKASFISPFLHCVQSDKTAAPESGREGMSSSWKVTGMRCALKKCTCVSVAAAGILLL